MDYNDKKNKELQLAFEFVQFTNKNIFLTGKAGTGKTTFLKSLKERSPKRMVVVAPTGVAAINAGGSTIHSFFQLDFGPLISEMVSGEKKNDKNKKFKFRKNKINIIKSLDLLIIDEISMVRADMLDAIDEVLRKYKNRKLPFGGVQLLMIGDMQQLAPVVKSNEWQVLSKYYSSMFFFHSHALKQSDWITIELKKVYRQKDGVFLDILNEIRDNKLSEDSYNLLHKRYKPEFKPTENEGYVNLTTHNRQADEINYRKLEELDTESKYFEADIFDNFPEHSYPTEENLELKVGAQVMFIKNDSSPEKRYYNGKIGKITAFEDDNIIIKCPGDDEEIETSHEKWENIKYKLNEQSKEIEEKVAGSFSQYPLRLAWAITIHKSQGLTFERAVIDAKDAFAHGQTYVALSRCTNLEGLVLSSKISEKAIISSSEINVFNKEISQNQPDEKILESSKNKYQFDLLKDLFSFKRIAYLTESLERIIEKHRSIIQGEVIEDIQQVRKKMVPELLSLEKKFQYQIYNLLQENADAENNSKLQERIKKASEYFYTYFEKFIEDKFSLSSFETDNKEVSKQLESRLESIKEEIKIKQESFDLCKKGFKIKEYLSTKAKAGIEEKKTPKKVNVEYSSKGIKTKHPELYSTLKYWRHILAMDNSLPHYRIASTKMLVGIANELPTNTKEMLAIHGFGKVKLKQYGEEILAMVMEYIVEKGIDKEIPDEVKLEPVKKKTKKEKKPSHLISLEMYKDGKSVKEIAEERDFVEGTIQGHLAKYIKSGEVDINDFVSKQQIEEIQEYYKENPESTLNEAKSTLDDDISYAQIRMVLSLES